MRDLSAFPDEHVAALARLYAEHPAWRDAAQQISAESSSSVWFRHRPREPWQLVRELGHTRLKPGPATDPDFVFRFTPKAIRELEAAGRNMEDVAVRLFELMIDSDESVRVEFRIAASFPRLVRRGYVGLLLAAGPRLAAFASQHGVVGLGSLRRLVSSLRREDPFDWEQTGYTS